MCSHRRSPSGAVAHDGGGNGGVAPETEYSSYPYGRTDVREMSVQGDERGVQPVVPSCGTPVRGRLRFVVAELGSVWRELRDHRRRRPARNRSGGVR